MQQKRIVKQDLLCSFVFILVAVALIECQNRQKQSRRIDNPSGRFRSPCGTAEQVSERVGRCLDEIFEIVEGRITEAKNDEDLNGHCNRFNRTEKCVRAIAKDCLSGLHKTAVGSVASATKRFRTQECKTVASRSRYADPLKCAIKKGKVTAALYRNQTGIAQGIRDLNISPEEKLMKTCCLLNSMDREVENTFNSECPKSTPLVLGILHAMTDDARSTLCVAPKCSGALNDVIKHPYKGTQNFIEPVVQILFMLSTE